MRVPIRRAILHAGSSELKNRRGSGQPPSLLPMDTTINDKHGHLVGDRVLAHFAQTVGRALRHTDNFGCFGSEEFVVLLPHTALASMTAVSASEAASPPTRDSRHALQCRAAAASRVRLESDVICGR
uniref:diguanylate cyclase n=1 Tax=Cupriavidus yeoncheonensis TaxID=1462994 RepID=UPI003F491C94